MELAGRISVEDQYARARNVPDRASNQAECDLIQADVRHGGVPLVHESIGEPLQPLAPTLDPIEGLIRDELEYAQNLLEVVGDRFVSDPQILERHMTTMQSFDIIGQLLGHLAKVVGSQDKVEAIDRIGMQELRARLKRPLPVSLASA